MAILVVGSLASSTRAAEPPKGLSVSPDGALLLAGRPFRGIGVNYYDCFQRLLADPDPSSVESGFRQLELHHVPFARLAVVPYWPIQMRLYRRDPDAFWRRLDQVLRLAERHHVGLILSLFWNHATLPDLLGEPCDQWGNPDSRTRAFMRDFTRQVVSRYKDSPVVWAWEFGNEFNLQADLPHHGGKNRPPVHPALGTPQSRSARDDLSSDMIRSAFTEFATEVRRLDPDRLIESGNSIPRASAWHLRHDHSWTPDTPAQQAQALADDNPDPMNAVSVHLYEPEDFSRLPNLLAAARRLNKPLLIGEFGAPGPRPKSQPQFKSDLATLVRARVSLAAVWVFDFPAQPEWSVTADNDRSYQLQAIQAANEELDHQSADPHAPSSRPLP